VPTATVGDQLRLRDKVAVITGGARGFGGAATELFAREGAKVVIGDIAEDTGTALTEKLVKEGLTAVFVKTDVTIPAQMQRLIRVAVDKFDRLDVLVANAGVIVNASVEELSEDQYHTMLDINLKGVWLAIKYSLPEMRRGGGGSIVVTSSSGALRGSKRSPLYAASKAGVVMLAHTVALNTAGENIRCNVVSPGPAATELFRSQGLSPEEFGALALPSIPMGRLCEPIDVARAMLFLAGDESRFCTGAVLAVDGGHSL